MDSLVANYASSDEEEQEEQQHQRSSSSLSKPTFKPGFTLPPPNSSNSHSISLPPPTKTSSIFGSLPPPKSSSIFKSLPLPKTHQSKPEKPINFSQSDPLPKRVVQFKPPIDPSVLKIQEDHKEEKPKPPTKNLAVSTENSSSKSGLAALLPPPKNSFGVASSSSSAGRRSVVETDAPAVNRDQNEANSRSGTDQEHEIVNSGNRVSFEESSGLVYVGAAHENYGNSIPGAYQEHEIVNSGNWVSSEESSGLVNVGASHENYESYGNYENYGSFENQQYWEGTGEEGKVDGSFSSSSGIGGDQPVSIDESVSRLIGKRGRNEIPTNIIEVKQDQLINNRPREDQVKLTGIAFGPSYQPVSSVKGKPSKLHKRKHQIGSLYFDMKQKETELAERRSRGFLTKAETQAKYGW